MQGNGGQRVAMGVGYGGEMGGDGGYGEEMEGNRGEMGELEGNRGKCQIISTPYWET